MAKTSFRIRYSNDAQTRLAAILGQVAQRHGMWQCFRDFVALAAITLSNAVDRSQSAQRQADYHATAKRYRPEELQLFTEGFQCVVDGLETGMHDFLGELFMGLGVSNDRRGQFFTPYEVALLMARINTRDAKQCIDSNGFLTFSDPCCGSGAMTIAFADALKDDGINFQRCMHATVQDIDLVAVHMAYIQLSLLGVPAVVIHGDSLAVETRSEWRTFAHVTGLWEGRLARGASWRGAKRLVRTEAKPATSGSPSLSDAQANESPVLLPSG